MPKSHVRKKKVYTPPVEIRPTAETARRRPSPRWVPVTAVVLLIAGLTWLVVYYLSEQLLPVESWANWNIAVAFGLMLGGLALLSRWR